MKHHVFGVNFWHKNVLAVCTYYSQTFSDIDAGRYAFFFSKWRARLTIGVFKFFDCSDLMSNVRITSATDRNYLVNNHWESIKQSWLTAVTMKWVINFCTKRKRKTSYTEVCKTSLKVWFAILSVNEWRQQLIRWNKKDCGPDGTNISNKTQYSGNKEKNYMKTNFVDTNSAWTQRTKWKHISRCSSKKKLSSWLANKKAGQHRRAHPADLQREDFSSKTKIHILPHDCSAIHQAVLLLAAQFWRYKI